MIGPDGDVETDFDFIVLGLGAMGSATTYQLAKAGAAVLGLEQFQPPHTFGSSHGDTRVTRQAIGEGAHYSPLALRSHELWREIEQATGRRLLETCGCLLLASEDAGSQRKQGFFENTVNAAQRFGIPHELLSVSAIRARFPQFALRGNERGYFEPGAGYVCPEECIRAQLELAVRHGAVLRTDERVTRIAQEGNHVVVETGAGRYTAGRVVVTAGAWLPQLVPGLARFLTVYRQVLYWFEPTSHAQSFGAEKFPVFIWKLPHGSEDLYGFPAMEGSTGVKIATEQYVLPTTPATMSREVSEEEIAAMHAQFVAPNFPWISARCLKAVACPYTVTPDSGFIIDELPGQERVLIASPCSGHGFKHSAAIGEALAQRVVEGKSRIDLSPYALSRQGS